MTGLPTEAMKRYYVTMTRTWTGDIEASSKEEAEELAVEKFEEHKWDEQEFEVFDNA